MPAVADALEARVAERPDDDGLAVALARLETQAQRPGQAIEVLVRAARHVADARRQASLLLDAAILCADRAGRPTEALVHLYEAYALDPDQGRAVDVRLEAVAERWGGHAEVADMLVDIYERLQRPDRVHAALERRLVDVPAGERPALLLRLGEHAEYQLVDGPRAFEWYRQGARGGRGRHGRGLRGGHAPGGRRGRAGRPRDDGDALRPPGAVARWCTSSTTRPPCGSRTPSAPTCSSAPARCSRRTSRISRAR
ncbi:MAG: hypothetical protein H6704_09115 [Myxococcales bacterium]|nr:hypothetical protein [Myxococcales bacterium]